MNKAKKFNRLGLVEDFTVDMWMVHPIPGYNKTTYEVILFGGQFRCNCQFNRTKKKTCSHILAVELHEEIKDEKIN